MTRREFIKATAAFAAVAAGWRILRVLEGNRKKITPDDQSATDPGGAGVALQDGLSVVPVAEGAEVRYDGELMFTVNEPGRRLLALTDGAMPLDVMFEKAGLHGQVAAACLFLAALGEAGYLKNRVEFNISGDSPNGVIDGRVYAV